MNVIKITCTGAAMVPIVDLHEFQGNLKSLPQRDFEKLRAAIERHGYSFPVQVWQNSGTNFIIDGHQGVYVVTKMMESGEFILEGGELPVDWIQAKNRKEAKEKVLLRASQYGKIDAAGLTEFITEAGLELADLVDTISLPTIDLDMLYAPPDETAMSVEERKLADMFLVPPFTVLDARQGYWQDRKKIWLNMGLEPVLGRGTNLLKFSEQATISVGGKMAPEKSYQKQNRKRKGGLGAVAQGKAIEEFFGNTGSYKKRSPGRKDEVFNTQELLSGVQKRKLKK